MAKNRPIAAQTQGAEAPRATQRRNLEQVTSADKLIAEGLRYEAIQRSPSYRQLVRERSSFGWTLSAVMLVIYFGFILLVAYAPGLLGTPLGTGVTTIGIVIGLLVIISAFVLTGVYVARANTRYDSLIRAIVEEAH